MKNSITDEDLLTIVNPTSRISRRRKDKETCSKYAGSVKFNGIPREGKPAIPINSYRDQ